MIDTLAEGVFPAVAGTELDSAAGNRAGVWFLPFPGRAQGVARKALPLLILMLVAVGCGSSESRYDAHLERASALEAQGDLPAALIELRSALQLQPKDPDANFRIAMVLRKMERPTEAVFFFQEAYRLDPERHEAALEAAAHMLQGDTDAAEALVDGVLAKEPKLAAAHASKAAILLVRSDAEGALTEALTAVELAPKDPNHHLLVGQVHQARIQLPAQRGETAADDVFRAAIAAFERAAALSDGFASESLDQRLALRALSERARTFASWPGHEAETFAALDETIARARQTGDPSLHVRALREKLGFALARAQVPIQVETLERLVEVAPEDLSAWTALARLEGQQGRSAETVYRRLLESQPESGPARVAFAQFLAETGRPEEAIAAIEAAVEEKLDPPTTLASLVELATRLDRPEVAQRAADQLQKDHPDSPQAVSVAAQRSLAEGRPEKAIAELETALTRREWPEGFIQLAAAQLAAGQPELAMQSVDRAMSLVPTGAFWDAADRLRGRIYARQRDWPAVLRSFQRLESNGVPLQTEEQLIAARAFYATGRDSAARRVLDGLLERDPPPAAAVQLFVEREAKADPERARALVETALAASPGAPGLVAARVQLDVESGDLEAAERRLAEALAASPTPSLDLRLLRARLLAAQGRVDEAHQLSIEILRTDPGLSGLAPFAGAVAQAAGKVETLLETLRALHGEDRLDVEALEVLARLERAFGRDDESQALYEEVLQRAPDRPLAQGELAFLLAERGGDLDRALSLARAASSARPDDPNVTGILGIVLFRKGLSEPALAQFQSALRTAEESGMESAAFRYHVGLALAQLGRREEARAAFEETISSAPDSPTASDAKAQLQRLDSNAG